MEPQFFRRLTNGGNISRAAKWNNLDHVWFVEDHLCWLAKSANASLQVIKNNNVLPNFIDSKNPRWTC